MKLADAARMMLRRWYIVVPGLLIAVGCALSAWVMVGPEYERQGAQIILPGASSLPEGATNPYLYLSGLALPTDILVQAVMGQDVMDDVIDGFPGTKVEVSRSGTSAPIITIVVSGASDHAAEQVLIAVMDRTVSTLESMQDAEGIPGGSRMSIATLAVDTQSTLIQRTRILITAAVGLGVVILALVIAALIEGLSTRHSRTVTRSGNTRGHSAEKGQSAEPAAGTDTEDDAEADARDPGRIDDLGARTGDGVERVATTPRKKAMAVPRGAPSLATSDGQHREGEGG